MIDDANNIKASDKIYAQAADWVALVESETISVQEEVDLQNWLEQDAHHFNAYQRMQDILKRTEFLDDNISDIAQELLSEFPDERHAAPPAFARKQFVIPAIAAGIFSIAVLSLLFFGMSPDSFETKVGEQRTMVLKDGSRVYLNALSMIEVDYQADQRVIELVAGEALFDVAHDPNRPFIVQVGTLAVRAIGTRFNVLSRRSETTVTVLEGQIKVTPAGKGLSSLNLPSSNAPVLNIGEQIVFSNGSLTDVMPVNVSRVTAWREGRIYIERRPLRDLVYELNRHFPGRITVENPILASMDVNVNLRLQNKETTFRMLEQMLQIRIVETSAGNTSIMYRDSN